MLHHSNLDIEALHNTKRLLLNPCLDAPPDLLRRGIEQFNRGEYFLQHETLEDLWRQETRPIRRLYQGILQVGVAMYHLQQHNHHGVVYMLTRGSDYLRPFTPTCQGVDVAALLTDATRLLETVEQLGPERLDTFDWSLSPTVRWVTNLQETTPPSNQPPFG